ncbi:AraC family transcriptional regulator [Chlorogloeopsis sp. ULAP01]|uniref:helix-turn-helix transcriptional regulator n=1 Tax=Chlorogloeopsis sp. ULAP01 TaxID=3056483 RepID=UPI0025AB156A|nr:AraC family transcriptional regulator [Chlorogloeopsis sp. ULAP01]MDM9383893.1 AraC family transcriptional regulator [Chlorogloeopsis sp. ULAP01]
MSFPIDDSCYPPGTRPLQFSGKFIDNKLHLAHSSMTLILSQSDFYELYQQAPQPQVQNLVLDSFEQLEGVPEIVGRGYNRSMNLSPGVWLNFLDCEYHQDLMVKTSAHEHPIQMGIFLSGLVYFDDVHPNMGGTHGYFSGSGISPGYIEKYRAEEHLTAVNVEIEPELLDSFLLEDGQYSCDIQNLLFKGEDWKISFYPKVTRAMRSLAQQMWNPPYRGTAKRMYLQAKVFELVAMHLDWISAEQKPIYDTPGLKRETIDRIHQAKEILTTQLEHPPSLCELAQQVGVSVRTLHRGFPVLFNTTVVGYLTQQRLQKAEMLLRQGNYQVSEVANLVGYGHLGNFAAAFKRQYGITPSQCLAGKKAVFGS